MAQKIKVSDQIDVRPITIGKMDICIVGRTPFVCNRVTEKAQRELIFPKPRMTKADKATRLKHDPLEEYRNSPYLMEEADAPTFLATTVESVKRAITDVAVDSGGGLTRAGVGRLIWPEQIGLLLPLWGVPKIYMDVVKQGGQNKAPDIRTRAILTDWATTFTLCFVEPNLRPQQIATLANNAGYICGLGDFRQQKGAGSYGQYEVVPPNNKRFVEIVKHGGRQAQKAAWESPQSYNRETKELLAWFEKELITRGYKRTDDGADKDQSAVVRVASDQLGRRRRGNGKESHA